MGKLFGQQKMTLSYIEKLREKSIVLARTKGFSKEVIYALETIQVKIISDQERNQKNKVLFKGKNMWFGYVNYGSKSEALYIGVLENNILSKGTDELINDLRQKGASPTFCLFLQVGFKLFPYKHLKYIIDQSGFDHELVGHFGNYLSNRKHGESEAIQAQVDGFKLRKSFKGYGVYRWVCDKIGRIALNIHKKGDIKEG